VKGYYAQDQSDSLDPEKTVFKTIDDIAIGDIRPKIRTILGSFLFSGEDIDKKVKVLSGGEKSRLSIAKLLLTPANLLILDEPTNHLDMRSKDILKNALLQFNGTLIIVSHDRDFLQGLSNRVFEFRDGGIREYLGDIYDFLDQKKLRELESSRNAERGDSSLKEPAPAPESKVNWEKKREFEREVRKLKTKISKSEDAIAYHEEGIRRCEEMLVHPEKYAKQIADGSLYREYEDIKRHLAMEMQTWEDLNRQLDAMTRG
jgi:ATP-binding cassette subfamily F protein 3